MKYLFETERLMVRELNDADGKDMADILLNKHSMRYYDKVFAESDVTEWIKKNQERYTANGFGLWAVIRKGDDMFLGDCGVTLQQIDDEVLPEIGFHIKEAYCRRGYAAEAALGSLRYVKETHNIKTIYSYCHRENIPSQGVMKKIGMCFMKSYKRGEQEIVVYGRDI